MESSSAQQSVKSDSQLALFGGTPAVRTAAGNIFTWPIITSEHEDAALEVLRRGAMSGTDVTAQLETEFAAWQGSKYVLGCSSGTAAMHIAMFGCRVGAGDEIISPSMTYWAAAMPALTLGATIVFADIDPNTLCIDPADIEHRITDRTKAIVVVHIFGHPCDMDPIMEIANRHGIKVIEDVAHAPGALYKGRKLGSIGHVGAFSIMPAKPFGAGEGGLVATDDREIFDYCTTFGHYERFNAANIETEALKPFAGLPLGGYKYRMHQLSSAVGRVQLKYLDEQLAEANKAMDYFWELLEGVPGLRPHHIDEADGSKMGGRYAPHGLYRAAELGGLPIARFCEAVTAEGGLTGAGANIPLHLHPALTDCDIFGAGQPTLIAQAHNHRDVRLPAGSLPVTERISNETYYMPPFKRYNPQVIEEQANAYRKVAENYRELLGNEG